MARVGPRLALLVVLIVWGCVGDRLPTVEFIVPFREGGGSDQWARAVAPFFQRHFSEPVRIQVFNIPGASGVQGGNEFAVRRPHDGRSLFISSGSNVFPALLGLRAVQYDFKEMRGIMGSPVGGVVYVSSELGIANVNDLCGTNQRLIYGGISPTGLDMVPLIAFEFLGLDVLTILGYEGKGAARVAFEQRETNLDYQTSPAYLSNVQPLVDEGSAIPLFSFGMLDAQGRVVRDPVFNKLPSMAEAYELCRGRAPAGAAWDAYRAALVAGFTAQKNLWTHDDAPPERIDALIATARATIADPSFQQLATRLLGGYEFYAGSDVEAIFSVTSQLSPTAREWLMTFLREKHDVRF